MTFSLVCRATRFAAVAACAAAPLAAQRPLNLDFERASVSYADRPWGWALGWSAFTGGPAAYFRLDSIERRSGRTSLRITVPDTGAAPQALMLQVPGGFAHGRVLELEGWVRMPGAGATARVHLEAWGDRVVPAGDTAVRTAAGGWNRERLRIAVPADSTIHSIVVMVSVEGKGEAWFDGFVLSLDGRPLTELPSAVAAPTPAELRALAPLATPLTTVDPGAESVADLSAIDQLIAGARIVALGESTHGTREFFQVKDRLLRYLVQHHGYRVFAIEANQLSVERINRYVQGAEGSAREVARAMFAVWNTEEVATLIDWIRGYNAGHSNDPVRFAGYDMQDHRMPIDSLKAFLRGVEPKLVDQVEELTREYRLQSSYATYQVADSVRLRWAVQADTVLALIQRRQGAWLAEGHPAAAVEWAAQSARLYQQAARFNVALNSPDRDSLMAVNLEWLLRSLVPGAKAVVWAHDVHVSHGGDPVRSFNAGAQMGAHLRRSFGEQYRALSLLTYEGQYTATRSFTDHVMMAVDAFVAPEGSMEEALHRMAHPANSVGWVVDLRTGRGRPGLGWLETARPVRHVGYAAYDYGFDLTAVFPLEFDGIVFIDHTSASRLLRSSPP